MSLVSCAPSGRCPVGRATTQRQMGWRGRFGSNRPAGVSRGASMDRLPGRRLGGRSAGALRSATTQGTVARVTWLTPRQQQAIFVRWSVVSVARRPRGRHLFVYWSHVNHTPEGVMPRWSTFVKLEREDTVHVKCANVVFQSMADWSPPSWQWFSLFVKASECVSLTETFANFRH